MALSILLLRCSTCNNRHTTTTTYINGSHLALQIVLWSYTQVELNGDITSGRCVDLVKSYLNSDQYKSLQKSLNPILEEANRDREGNKVGKIGKRLKSGHHLYATSFLWQVYL